eukprot:5209936-Pleurochrysis_carterae.AAC.1
MSRAIGGCMQQLFRWPICGQSTWNAPLSLLLQSLRDGHRRVHLASGASDIRVPADSLVTAPRRAAPLIVVRNMVMVMVVAPLTRM